MRIINRAIAKMCTEKLRLFLLTGMGVIYFVIKMRLKKIKNSSLNVSTHGTRFSRLQMSRHKFIANYKTISEQKNFFFNMYEKKST